MAPFKHTRTNPGVVIWQPISQGCSIQLVVIGDDIDTVTKHSHHNWTNIARLKNNLPRSTLWRDKKGKRKTVSNICTKLKSSPDGQRYNNIRNTLVYVKLYSVVLWKTYLCRRFADIRGKQVPSANSKNSLNQTRIKKKKEMHHDNLEHWLKNHDIQESGSWINLSVLIFDFTQNIQVKHQWQSACNLRIKSKQSLPISIVQYRSKTGILLEKTSVRGNISWQERTLKCTRVKPVLKRPPLCARKLVFKDKFCSIHFQHLRQTKAGRWRHAV